MEIWPLAQWPTGLTQSCIHVLHVFVKGNGRCQGSRQKGMLAQARFRPRGPALGPLCGLARGYHVQAPVS